MRWSLAARRPLSTRPPPIAWSHAFIPSASLLSFSTSARPLPLFPYARRCRRVRLNMTATPSRIWGASMTEFSTSTGWKRPRNCTDLQRSDRSRLHQLDGMVGGARRERHEGHRGIDASRGCHLRAIGDEQVGRVMRLAETIYHRRARIGPDSGAAHFVNGVSQPLFF